MTVAALPERELGPGAQRAYQALSCCCPRLPVSITHLMPCRDPIFRRRAARRDVGAEAGLCSAGVMAAICLQGRRLRWAIAIGLRLSSRPSADVAVNRQ